LNTPGEQNAVDNLLRSPLGVFVLARCISEVSDTSPGMPCAGFTAAEDLARCLQALSTREASSGCFDRLSAERLSELIVQCEAYLTPYWDGYQQQAEVLLASSASLRPIADHLLQAAGTGIWFAELDRQRQEWMSTTDRAPDASSFHPDLHSYGAGITKPRRALWTSTSVGEGSSGWLHYLRWGEDRREPPYLRWRRRRVSTRCIGRRRGRRSVWPILLLPVLRIRGRHQQPSLNRTGS
jgi:hypothetical protein